MAFNIDSTTVITDAVAINNITAIDEASTKSMLFGLMTENSIAAGTTLRASRDAEVTSSSTTFVTHTSWGFEQKGTVNFYFEIRGSSVSGSMRILRNRNGAQTTVHTQNITSTSYVAFSTDQSVLPGDVFTLQIQSGATLIIGYIRNVRIRTSSTTVYIPIEDAINSFFWYTAAY